MNINLNLNKDGIKKIQKQFNNLTEISKKYAKLGYEKSDHINFRNPENQNFGKIINLDENGYIIASEDCHTNIEGIFVAGDNRVKVVRQLVTAESDGAIAAIEATKYLNK